MLKEKLKEKKRDFGEGPKLGVFFFVAWIFTFSFFISCSSFQNKSSKSSFHKKEGFKKEGFKKNFQQSHEKKIQAYTREHKAYRGFKNTFQVWVTLINSSVQDSILKSKARFMGWSDEIFFEEQMRLAQEASTQSQMVISLFTPQSSENDLDKNSRSIWRVYLEVNGLRYLGKAQKWRGSFDEQKRLFPHHSSFCVLYGVTFDIPMTEVEKQISFAILTSYLGIIRLNFPPVLLPKKELTWFEIPALFDREWMFTDSVHPVHPVHPVYQLNHFAFLKREARFSLHTPHID